MDIQMKLAGVPFCVKAMFAETKTLCAAYLTEETPAFTIEIDRDVIENERELLREYQLRTGRRDLPETDAEVESNALYRLTAEYLSAYRTLLIHGSAIAVDGEAYLFAAPSGTGKSTHTRLWREVFGDRAVMVNDDKPLVRVTETGALICGSPWNGKHHLDTNVTVPLRAICFLDRGNENRIEPTGGRTAFLRLMKSTYHSKNVENQKAILKSLELLYRQVRFYQLSCNMNPEAANVSYKGMVNGNESKT